MTRPAQHHSINYVEFASTDIDRSKRFYEKVFGWNFQNYGPDYIAFDVASAGIDGGLRKAEIAEPVGKSAPLIVIYSQDLKATEAAILKAGGEIVVATFEFP